MSQAIFFNRLSKPTSLFYCSIAVLTITICSIQHSRAGFLTGPIITHLKRGLITPLTQTIAQTSDGFLSGLEEMGDTLIGTKLPAYLPGLTAILFESITDERINALTSKFFNSITPKHIDTLRKRTQPAFTALCRRSAFEATAIAGITTLGVWGTYRVIKYAVDPPVSILLPGSVISTLDQFRRKRAGYPHPTTIYSADVDKTLNDLIQSTNDIIERIKSDKEEGLTFDNILLSGPPGTGKTLWLDKFAAKTKLRIAKITAASLAQPGAGVAALDKLIKSSSENDPLIIAIDEFDALGADRRKIAPGTQLAALFNDFLARTGTRNSTVIFIATTNMKTLLDPAMERRFQHHVEIGLPDDEARLKVATLFCEELILSNKKRGEAFINEAQSVLNTETLQEFSNKARELSTAEIRDVISSAYKKTFKKGSERFTKDHLMAALEECITKKHSLSSK